MKQHSFYRSVALLVAAQMALSPLAIANEQKAAPKEAHWTETAASVMGLVNAAGSSVLNAMQQQTAARESQNRMNALTSQMNPSVCGQNGQQRQCVSEIFPECNILNTRPNFVEPADCTQGVDASDPAGAAKAGSIMGYYNHYAQMENIYKNFNLETNATSNTGLGCLNARADQLARTLKNRENEIDNLINKMQKAQDAFKKQAEADRNKIEDAMALLEGENFKGATRSGKGILDQNSVNFANTFNDPACQSVVGPDDIKKLGKNGLKGIESQLSSIANKKEGGGFNAVEFNSAIAQNLEQDIRKMSELAAKEIEVGNAAGFIERGIKAPSAFGLGESPAFKGALLEQQKEAQLKDIEISQEVAAVTGGRSESLAATLKNERADFEFALNRWERDEKDSCLRQQTNINALISDDLKIIDPSASSSANRFADNAYRTFIKNTLARTDISIEQKMNMIAEEEGKNGNTRYLVNTQASATVDGEVIQASTRLSPARFVQIHIDNCKKQFEQNANEKGFSGRQVVEKLREARNKYSAFQRTLAGKVKASIVDRLLNCNDSTQANANGVGTCSARDLSAQSPGFCVKRANSCATNMRQCLAKAEKKVQEVVAKRDQAVGQYKANLAKNEADLNKMYAMVEQITAVDGLNIAASLKQALVLPTEDLKFHIDQDKRKLVRGMESMEVQDPDQYFNQMKDNLLSLKKQVAKQNKAVMFGDQEGGLASQNSTAQRGVYGHIDNIKNNMTNIMQDIQKYKEECKQAYAAFMGGLRQQRSAQAEANNKSQQEQSDYCRKVNTLTVAPTCDNADQFDSIIAAAYKAGDAQTTKDLGAFKKFCKSYGSDPNVDANDSATFKKRFGVDEKAFCTNLKTAADDKNSVASVSMSLECQNLLARLKCTTEQKNNEECKANLKDLIESVITKHKADIPQSNKAREDEFERLTTNLGENSSGMCTAQNNSGMDSFQKALMEAAGNVGQAAGAAMSN